MKLEKYAGNKISREPGVGNGQNLDIILSVLRNYQRVLSR